MFTLIICRINNKKLTSSTRFLKSQFGQLCGGFGKKLCTCYYPDHSDVTIFELRSDEITTNAFYKINGTGPSNCTDLQNIGHSLKGFYAVRFNGKRINSIYCDFNEIELDVNTNVTASSSKKTNASAVSRNFAIL